MAKQDLEGVENLEEVEATGFSEIKEEEKEKVIEEAEVIRKLSKVPMPQDILSRGLQSLKKADHIKFITKSARLEYQCG